MAVIFVEEIKENIMYIYCLLERGPNIKKDINNFRNKIPSAIYIYISCYRKTNLSY